MRVLSPGRIGIWSVNNNNNIYSLISRQLHAKNNVVALKRAVFSGFTKSCFPKLRSNDRTIQVICFVKAMYRLHVFRRNPRDGCYFHEQKNDIIKINKDLDVFVVALKRAVFSGFTKSCFKIFLNFT